MAAISRSEATRMLIAALKRHGYTGPMVSQVVTGLGMPGRMTSTEVNTYTQRALVSMRNQDPGLALPEADPELRPSSRRPTGQEAASSIIESIAGAFRDNGWANPDQTALRYLNYVAPSGADARTKYDMDHVRLIRSIANRWYNNPEMGWQLFVSNVEGMPAIQGFGPSIDEQGGMSDDTYGLGDDLLTGSFGGGYGGGYAAPVYVPPDRRLVEDAVRGQMARTVGAADNTRLQHLTDLYMREHRRSWDNPELGLDPSASVTEQLRGQDDYKRIHTLRPDFVDEQEWVTAYQSGGIQSGLSAQEAEKFAIDQATLGTKVSSIRDVAGVQAMRGGHKTPEFVERYKSAAKAVFARVR